MKTLPTVTDMLADGLPITLLIDLLAAAGPDSRRIYLDEPSDESWLPPAVRRSAA